MKKNSLEDFDFKGELYRAFETKVFSYLKKVSESKKYYAYITEEPFFEILKQMGLVEGGRCLYSLSKKGKAYLEYANRE